MPPLPFFVQEAVIVHGTQHSRSSCRCRIACAVRPPQHICAGHNGVRHHQSKSPTCCAALTDAPPPLQRRSSYLDRRIPSTAPSPFDDDALLSLYSVGLFTVHRTWSEKIYSVAFRRLTIIVENRTSTAPIASLAFTLLSGVVGAYIANVSTTDDVQFSNMILDSARKLAPTLAAKRELGQDWASGPLRPNATRLRLRIARTTAARPTRWPRHAGS